MSRDPAVLFYTSDFLSGTAFFSMEERGKYITLLCEQHQLWSIPVSHLVAVCGSLDSPVAKKFIPDTELPGCFFNQRMREESLKRKNFCDSRRTISNSRKEKNYHTIHRMIHHTTDRMIDHTVHRMENENAIGIGIELNTTKDSIKYKSDTIDLFEAFWKEYPKKVGKGAAEKSWKKISSIKSTFEKIIIALEWQKKSEQWRKDGGQYIPNPATYINQKRWMDEKKDDVQESIDWSKVFDGGKNNDH